MRVLGVGLERLSTDTVKLSVRDLVCFGRQQGLPTALSGVRPPQLAERSYPRVPVASSLDWLQKSAGSCS